MAHKRTQYGTLIDSGVPKDTGGTEGFLELMGSVNVTDMTTMPTEFIFDQGEMRTVASEGLPDVLTLQLTGNVFGSEETLSVCYVIPWMDVGGLIAMMLDCAERSPGQHSMNDLQIGLNERQAQIDLDRNSDKD